MNRVCFVTLRRGRDLVRIVSDLPIRAFSVSEEAVPDRVYEFTPGVGVQQFGREKVDALLRDDAIGHHFDDEVRDSWGRAIERLAAVDGGASNRSGALSEDQEANGEEGSPEG